MTTQPNTERQQRRRAALAAGLTHIRVWATPDNKAAIIDAKELGEQIIDDALKNKNND